MTEHTEKMIEIRLIKIILDMLSGYHEHGCNLNSTVETIMTMIKSEVSNDG